MFIQKNPCLVLLKLAIMVIWVIGSIILPNTKISDNFIVAAGSVVKGVFDLSVVIGGNPARVLCGLDEYFSKNMDRVIEFSNGGCRKSQVLKVLTN